MQKQGRRGWEEARGEPMMSSGLRQEAMGFLNAGGVWGCSEVGLPGVLVGSTGLDGIALGSDVRLNQRSLEVGF